MDSSPRDPDKRVVDEGAHSNPSGHPNFQVLPGAHGCKIDSVSAIVAGGNVIINNASPPIEGNKEFDSIQAKREAILKCLKAPTFHAVYASALEQRMARTGCWFLELPQFHKFVASRGVTLWCTGMPGAGKTILASVAVEHLRKATEESPHTALAFAFLRYSERYAWRDILTSLLVQLIEESDLACATFWPHYSRAAGKASSELIILVAVLETALCDIAGKLEKVYVAIDGLDEATDEVKDKLLETLVPSGVNLLILSRPLDLYTHHAPEALSVSIQAKTKDIELYVRGQVQKSSRLKSIFQGKPEKVSELCTKITLQSRGMFLVAKLQMGAITRSSKSISSLFRNLEALPGGIDAMYDLTLSRIRDSGDSSVAFRALAWVAYHAESGNIKAKLLQHALSFDPETQTFDSDDITPIPLILSACQGLVTSYDTDDWMLDTEDRVNCRVRFIHYSAYEYIKSAELDTDGFPNPQSLLALTCLACMEHHREHLIRLHRDIGPDEVDMYFYDDIMILLQYSHDYWGEHVASSQLPDSDDHYVYPFLSKHEEHALRIPAIELDPFGLEILTGANLAVMCDHFIGTGISGGRVGLQNARCLLPNIVSEPNGYTPFHLSAILGRFETFRSLLSLYSGANLRSKDGSTVLHVAIRCRQTSFIQQLYELVTQTPPVTIWFFLNNGPSDA